MSLHTHLRIYHMVLCRMLVQTKLSIHEKQCKNFEHTFIYAKSFIFKYLTFAEHGERFPEIKWEKENFMHNVLKFVTKSEAGNLTSTLSMSLKVSEAVSASVLWRKV